LRRGNPYHVQQVGRRQKRVPSEGAGKVRPTSPTEEKKKPPKDRQEIDDLLATRRPEGERNSTVVENGSPKKKPQEGKITRDAAHLSKGDIKKCKGKQEADQKESRKPPVIDSKKAEVVKWVTMQYRKGTHYRRGKLKHTKEK